MTEPTIEVPDETRALRQKLVDELKDMGCISSPRVEAAFRAVPRHLFVPGVPLEKAYTNTWIGTKQLESGQWISTSSSPDIMAIMLEQLGLAPGQHVLEIGAGTGYNAALIAHIVGETGQVVSIDIDEDIVAGAREHLAAAGYGHVHVVSADGGYGYPDAAPYDRIILSVGSADITSAWVEQLQPAGRLVLPLWLERNGSLQVSVAFEKREDYLASVSVKQCGYMPLRGAFASAPLHPIQLTSESGLEFGRDDGGPVDAAATYRLLTGQYRDLATDIQVTPRELKGDLYLWLLPLYEAQGCGLQASGEWLKRCIVPYLFSLADKYCSTGGVVAGSQTCALLMRPPGQSPPAEFAHDEPPFALYARSYGPDDVLAHRLIESIQAWDAAGRSTFQHLQVKAYPLHSAHVPGPNEAVLPRPSIRLVLSWKS